jgi:hypothetical protein
MKDKFDVIIEFNFIEALKDITSEYFSGRSAASYWHALLSGKIIIIITN